MGFDYKNSYKGGGKKDFKADPIKQYLTCRGTNESYAKDLAVAKLIKIEDIPEWSDRFTVLQFGKLQVDPKVDAEVMRIAARLKDKIQKREEAKDEMDRLTEENPVEEDEVLPGTMPEHKGCGTPEGGDFKDYPLTTDQQTEFDIDREREKYEQECAEEETNQTATLSVFKCQYCLKEYKTERGLTKHIEKEHGQDVEPEYGSQR